MIRNPANPNQTICYLDNYLGMPIQADKGPFTLEYLDRLYQTLQCAISQYRKVFAFRLDLRLPNGYHLESFAYENQIIDRFVDSFKAKIKHNRQMARKLNKYAHDSIVRYAWAREFGEQGRPHYHLVILLNYDAYCAIGTFSPGRDNMFNRLHEAWASALRLSLDAVWGSVEIPRNPSYVMCRDTGKGIAEFFYRASYLCKAATKAFGDGGHGFGASRN